MPRRRRERLALMNPAQHAGIEGKAAERLTAMMKGTREKVQLEYKSYVIGLGTYLKREYPAAWKKFQNDWDRGGGITFHRPISSWKHGSKCGFLVRRSRRNREGEMNMQHFVLDRLPSVHVWVSAALSAAIPWGVYVVNRAFHRYGDPPWKKQRP
ncbi:Ger(x)C family spore germination C-terminal domain-containing protein [Paenibacillus macerans]|uniref:Ger(x)C family spore germination C-terminal domain-containing protein n=1 Tax=Paenibacillus macerans TaxID=44252 RepID=UPI0022DFCCF5|nr:Ger(x)C family spore germination C-terminal domain-containing protein [Paenibacillus macerans]